MSDYDTEQLMDMLADALTLEERIGLRSLLTRVPSLIVAHAALKSERDALRAALGQIAQDAPTEKPERGEFGDAGNYDDEYNTGYERARWFDAEIARAALNPAQATEGR